MTPDPWRELEAKLSRSGYEDERECIWCGIELAGDVTPRHVEAHARGICVDCREVAAQRGELDLYPLWEGPACGSKSTPWIEPPDLTPEEAANYLEPHWELLYPRGPQRPSPEGLHAQEGREVGHIALNLETGEDLSSPPLVYRHWDPKRMVKKAPLRCRLGWHDWFGDGRLRTCTRCHKEKP